jgi:regulator of nonsense transcripts 2
MLLQTCGEYFNSGESMIKLDRFLLYFQRYILSKTSIPWDIEFTISDTFSRLRPKMVRFNTWENVSNAIVENEKQERQRQAQETPQPTPRAETRKALQAQDDDADAEPDEQTKEQTKDEDEEDDESVSSDMSTDSIDEDDYDDDDDDDEDEDEDDDEEDEELVVHEEPKPIERDDEFEAEYKRMLSESLEGARGRRISDMSIPLSAFGSSTKRAENAEANGYVPFKMLTKKGGKQKTVELAVPIESKMVQIKLKELEETKGEHEELKRRVLAYEEGQQEQEEELLYEPRRSVPQVFTCCSFFSDGFSNRENCRRSTCNRLE